MLFSSCIIINTAVLFVPISDIEKSLYDNIFDNSILEEKIAVEKAHSFKPLEKKNIVNFLKIYASKDFDSVRDRNDFFNNFISRVNLYDDRITIVYNTSLNPTEEIYNKPDNDPNNKDNNGGTTIYKTELNFENEQEKSRPNSDEFKRLLSGGEGGI